MAISGRVRKILWGRSGNRCAICRQELVADARSGDPESVIGQECHIRSGAPNGPRHDPNYPSAQVNEAENLLLLCPNHHKVVDDQTSAFSVATLEQTKLKHEAWVSRTLSDKAAPPGMYLIKERMVAVLPRITSGHLLMDILGFAHARQFSHPEPRSPSEVQLIAQFIQLCSDWSEIWDALQPGEQLLEASQMTGSIQELEERGLALFGAQEHHESRGGAMATSTARLAVLTIARSDDPRIAQTTDGDVFPRSTN